MICLSFDKLYQEEIVNFIKSLNQVVINNVTDWGEKISIDINDKKVSKGNSVKWLCNKLKIDLKDTIGFGDGKNDVSMFEVVGWSVSMGNASDEIKKLTNDVALNCNKYGLYNYIENNILK